MKPEAIRSAAIELIGLIEQSVTPANEIINTYTRARRYIGSKDRRTLTDLVWNYIRHKRRLDYLCPGKSVPDKMDCLDCLPESIEKAPFLGLSIW